MAFLNNLSVLINNLKMLIFKCKIYNISFVLLNCSENINNIETDKVVTTVLMFGGIQNMLIDALADNQSKNHILRRRISVET